MLFDFQNQLSLAQFTADVLLRARGVLKSLVQRLSRQNGQAYPSGALQ